MPEAIVMGAAIVDIPLAPVTRGIFDAHSTPVNTIAMQVGGDAANEARVIARLGHDAALLSVLGQDAAGDFVLNTIADAGVDVRGVRRRDDLETGINVVLVTPDGERSFVTNQNGSLRALSLQDIRHSLDMLDLNGVKIACLASLFVSYRMSLEDVAALFDDIQSRGLLLCADTTIPRHGETLEQTALALSRLDYFFPNAAEAAAITGEADADAAADALLRAGVKHVAIKRGSKGCLLASADERHYVPAVPGTRCVDTTGAGDTFSGAFISALLEGKSFVECGRFANAAASLCVESLGAVRDTWRRVDVEARYKGII